MKRSGNGMEDGLIQVLENEYQVPHCPQPTIMDAKDPR